MTDEARQTQLDVPAPAGVDQELPVEEITEGPTTDEEMVTGEDLLPWYAKPGKILDAVKALLTKEGEGYNPIPNGEAGFSDTFRIVDPDGIEHQLTFRGQRAEDWPYVLQQSANARRMLLHEGAVNTRWIVAYPVKGGGVQKTQVNGQASPGVPPPPPPPAGGATPTAPVNVPVTDSTDPGATPDSRGNLPGQQYAVPVSKIQVTPQQDGNVEIKFFPILSNGKPGDYAETSWKRFTAPEWAEVFQKIAPDWSEGHFAAAGEYMLGGSVEVLTVISDKQSKHGNYYKNYGGIQPAQG